MISDLHDGEPKIFHNFSKLLKYSVHTPCGPFQQDLERMSKCLFLLNHFVLFATLNLKGGSTGQKFVFLETYIFGLSILCTFMKNPFSAFFSVLLACFWAISQDVRPVSMEMRVVYASFFNKKLWYLLKIQGKLHVSNLNASWGLGSSLAWYWGHFISATWSNKCRKRGLIVYASFVKVIFRNASRKEI